MNPEQLLAYVETEVSCSESVLSTNHRYLSYEIKHNGSSENLTISPTEVGLYYHDIFVSIIVINQILVRQYRKDTVSGWVFYEEGKLESVIKAFNAIMIAERFYSDPSLFTHREKIESWIQSNS